jgi:hypothetical protein
MRGEYNTNRFSAERGFSASSDARTILRAAHKVGRRYGCGTLDAILARAIGRAGANLNYDAEIQLARKLAALAERRVAA